MEFREQYGPWALVTGASAGIGAEFARQLAEKKLNLLLTARRADRLEALRDSLQAEHNIEVRIAVADLSQPDFLEPIRRMAEGIEIGLVVNNAGYGIAGSFLNNDHSAERNMIHVNCLAPTVLAHHFARPMAERGRGGIIFVASILGYIPSPYMANYGATKAYDLFLAEALWQELRPAGIDVLALSPGPTESEFAQNAGMKTFASMPADRVVRRALRALGSAPSVTVSPLHTLLLFLTRFLSRKTVLRLVALSMRLLDRGDSPR